MGSPQATEPRPAAADPGPMTPRPFRVTGRRQDTDDTWTLTMEPADGGPPISYLPGQFNMLYAFGIGEIPVSISSPADGSGPLEHTVRAVGPASAAICRCEPGTQLGLRGPFGSSWPVSEAVGRHLVIVAGGLGLAPLRPALLEAIARRDELEGIVLLAGGRSPAELLFQTELEMLKADPRLEVGMTVDSSLPGEWSGHVGVVTTLIDDAAFDPANAIAMTCGPEVMMRFTVQALVDKGLRADDVYVSIERNMKCAVTQCGRCQFGPTFACREGAVLSWGAFAPFFGVREL